MKDIPHHMKKLNRRVIRSEHRLEEEDSSYAATLPEIPGPTQRPRAQMRKQAKTQMKKEHDERSPTPLSEEERNHRMKHRVPIFDRWNRPNSVKVGAQPSKKKKPRI